MAAGISGDIRLSLSNICFSGVKADVTISEREACFCRYRSLAGQFCYEHKWLSLKGMWYGVILGLWGAHEAARIHEARLSFAGEQRRAEMTNRLLATVAVAAVVGFGGLAAAQSQMGGESNKVPPGTTSDKIEQKSGVQLVSADQHSQIKTVIARVSGPQSRVDRRKIDFSVSIGTRVPRSVQVVTLPDEIVRIVPQYRGFNYFVISYRTKDFGGTDFYFVKDQLVIIDPKTLEIAAIIPV